MKILYTKCNSERAKEFQLQTTIFEVDGKKFVKKKALTKEAIAHIDNMKQNREALEGSILDKNLLLVPIVESSKDSITFEFINGESFDNRLKRVGYDSNEAKEMMQNYQNLLFNGFKSTKFDHTSMVTDKFKEIFGDFDYSDLDNTTCYDGICNLDMIFSNLIYKEDKLYLIDYEWLFNLSLPVEYILYRTYQMVPKEVSNILPIKFKNEILFHKMERSFIDNYVMKNSFYFYRNNYLKKNQTLEGLQKHIEQLEEHRKELAKTIHTQRENIDNLNETIQDYHEIFQNYQNTIHNQTLEINRLNELVNKISNELEYAHKTIELRDEQIQYLLPKNRIKHIFKKFNPLNKSPLYNPFNKVIETTKNHTPDYVYREPILSEEIKNDINNFKIKPLISIITPVYNVDPKWIEKAIKSVETQWYDNWELCIADDCSTNEATKKYLKSINNPKIKVKFLNKNLNISGASNAALELANGDYIALLDNDDELTPNALYEMVKVINNSNADFIYSDEDFISPDGVYCNPHFKPDFSPDLLLSNNYITHFSCFKKELLDRVGYFKSEYDGAQDYDLFLRLTEKTDKIYHIQKILYHWRMIEGSTSASEDAKPEAKERGKKAIEAALKRRNINAKVEYANISHNFRVRYEIQGKPLVSIIIPFKDKPELLDMCVNSLIDKTSYENFEVIGISNNSEEKETFQLMKELEGKDSRVKFYEYNVEFNYADINNYAVEKFAKGEHILLLNNDIEVIAPNWIEAMLEHSQRKEVGCVGAKLYYPNDTIQHAGVIIGLGGYAGHSHKHYTRESKGYYNRLMIVQNLSAVTAACLMIKKSIYQEVQGMDSVNFKVAFNDVDFCLRVKEKGYLNIFTPYAELYHHESISRGYETTPKKIARFEREKKALFERHKEILTNGDPYYNPNLCHDKEDFSICPK